MDLTARQIDILLKSLAYYKTFIVPFIPLEDYSLENSIEDIDDLISKVKNEEPNG